MGVTEEKLCRTCKHWQRKGWPDDNQGHCKLTMTRFGRVVVGKTRAWADSYSDEAVCELQCDETFGCIQHEEKD